jgi:hypothetical protein
MRLNKHMTSTAALTEEATTRTVKILKSIGADAARKGIDPAQHLTNFLATLPEDTRAGLAFTIAAVQHARKG